eukprot:746522-Hanusia_phi.AAC.9
MAKKWHRNTPSRLKLQPGFFGSPEHRAPMKWITLSLEAYGREGSIRSLRFSQISLGSSNLYCRTSSLSSSNTSRRLSSG